MASVKIKRGSEGPWHDPYSYTEITFSFTNKRRKSVVGHFGLGEWVAQGKRRVAEGDGAAGAFEKLTGLSPWEAERVPGKLVERAYRKHARECGGRIECVAGYPGESFEMCRKCSEVIDSHFHLSEIE